MHRRRQLPHRKSRPRQQRALLWVLFATLTAVAAGLLAIVGWAAWSGAWVYAVFSGALLLLILWRAELWLVTWARRLSR